MQSDGFCEYIQNLQADVRLYLRLEVFMQQIIKVRQPQVFYRNNILRQISNQVQNGALRSTVHAVLDYIVELPLIPVKIPLLYQAFDITQHVVQLSSYERIRRLIRRRF